MAEWSKALVLGTSLFGGVGSNPTPVTIFANPTWVSVVSSVVRIPAFQAGGPGSIPGRRTILHNIMLSYLSPRSSDGRAQDS